MELEDLFKQVNKIYTKKTGNDLKLELDQLKDSSNTIIFRQILQKIGMGLTESKFVVQYF